MCSIPDKSSIKPVWQIILGCQVVLPHRPNALGQGCSRRGLLTDAYNQPPFTQGTKDCPNEVPNSDGQLNFHLSFMKLDDGCVLSTCEANTLRTAVIPIEQPHVNCSNTEIEHMASVHKNHKLNYSCETCHPGKQVRLLPSTCGPAGILLHLCRPTRWCSSKPQRLT